MPTTPKHAAVQATVLEATEALLAEGATFAELGVERIARAAGISRTAFYFYFKDKRDLLMRLTEEVSEQLYAEADHWFSGTTDDLADALGNVAALYRAHGPLLKAIVDVSTFDEEVARHWRALLGRFIAATQARIEAAGRPPRDAHGMAFALVWMTERAFYQQMVQDEPVADIVAALAIVWTCAVYA